MNTASPHLHRVTPRRSGGVGAPLATTLANVPDAEVERADVQAILKNTGRQGGPDPARPPRRVGDESGIIGGDSSMTLPMIHRGGLGMIRPMIHRWDLGVTLGDSGVSVMVRRV